MELNLLIVTTLEQTAGLGVQVVVAVSEIISVKAPALRASSTSDMGRAYRSTAQFMAA